MVRQHINLKRQAKQQYSNNFFKDDIVYKQIGIYTYDPKGLGKSDEEVVQFLNKSQALYEGVTGIKSTVENKDGKYIQTVTFDYQTIDWRELYKISRKKAETIEIQ